MADTKIPGNSIILGFFDDFYLRYPNASPKQRTVKSFGYLEDQTDLEAFWKEVNACNDSLKHKRDLRIEIPVSEMMYSENNRLLNYGYKFPESVYHLLGIDTFFEQYQRSSRFRGKYSLNEIFRYLVMDRILYPASKREVASRLLNYYGLNSEFDLPDIYRALDQFNIIFYDLQRFISEQVGERFGRDLQYSFYDVTNYYTEKDFADPDEEYRDRSGKLVSGPALGQKGVSKEHQLTPIIQMGLFMDGNGVPICMDVFRGNMSDSDTLKENLDGFKKEYGMERTVVVADKGMNCSRNIDLLCSQGDGYVFSQILKGTKGKRYQEALFAQEGWQEAEDGSYKWKLLTEEYQGYDISFEMQDGQKTEKKNICVADSGYGSEKKAEKSTKNNAYGIVHGKDRYIKEETILKETGEVLDERQTAKVSAVDREKAEKDALYDGYFAIITSEMDYDAAKIREVYHGLWSIEESFQIMKSDFDARPIYLNKREELVGEKHQFVFVTDKGKPVYDKFIYRLAVKYLGEVTSLKKRSPHVLRHSFATALLNNGACIEAIRELLGHAGLAATQIYTHNSFESLKKVYNQAHPRA